MRGGFSLLEVVLVLVIVAFAAAIAGPRYANASARYRCDAAAQRIAMDLRYCQSTARATGASQTITFNQVGPSYQISSAAGLDNSSTYTVLLGNEPYRATINGLIFGDTSTSTVTVTFNAYGAASSGGSIIVGCGSFTHVISLNSSNGTVTIQ